MIEETVHLVGAISLIAVLGFIVLGDKKSLTEWVIILSIVVSGMYVILRSVEDSKRELANVTNAAVKLEEQLAISDKELLKLYAWNVELKKIGASADSQITAEITRRSFVNNQLDEAVVLISGYRKDLEWARLWLPAFMIGETNEL